MRRTDWSTDQQRTYHTPTHRCMLWKEKILENFIHFSWHIQGLPYWQENKLPYKFLGFFFHLFCFRFVLHIGHAMEYFWFYTQKLLGVYQGDHMGHRDQTQVSSVQGKKPLLPTVLLLQSSSRVLELCQLLVVAIYLLLHYVPKRKGRQHSQARRISGTGGKGSFSQHRPGTAHYYEHCWSSFPGPNQEELSNTEQVKISPA